MVSRDLVPLSSFLVEAKPPSFSFLVVILNSHIHGSADASEAENHHTNEGTVPQTYDFISVDRIEKLAGLVRGENRGFASLDGVRWTSNGTGGIRCKNLSNNQPIKEHPDCGKVLFLGWFGTGMGLNESGYMHRLNVDEFQTGFIAP